MGSLGWPCSHLTGVLRGDQDTDTHTDDHVRMQEEPALRHLDPALWPRGPQGPVVLDHSSPRTRTRYTCGGVKPHHVGNSLVVHWLGFVLSLPSVRVQSLVWDLRSHKICTTRTTANNPPCPEGCSENHGSGVTVVPPTWTMEFCGSNTCQDPARAAGSWDSLVRDGSPCLRTLPAPSPPDP